MVVLLLSSIDEDNGGGLHGSSSSGIPERVAGILGVSSRGYDG